MVRVPEAKFNATKQGKAKLRVLDFKTIWSKFQKPYQTAVRQCKAERSIFNLKETSPPQSWSQAVVCVSTTRRDPRSGYFLVSKLKRFSTFCDPKKLFHKITYQTPEYFFVENDDRYKANVICELKKYSRVISL